ncbi:hypothetical protein NECAME_01578 [Necator americanus]|uniref:Uncharacterized protein n=1 Tax=Necator americanus TaxID=51031 RepID=W2TRE6_NECAM|nr:hypothetical protein NECAME_01578 [Necator americanus]ETN84358.1 hypothetical protein NECAME_01578 [Necator americanus]
MDSFAMLNEEVFKHLCSLAIDKVSDKTERRKAGCGGMAMRKRLLIKNFVNDLCRKKDEQIEERNAGDCSSHDPEGLCGQNNEIDETSDSISYELQRSHDSSDITDDDGLEEDDVIVAEDDDITPMHDIWLDSAAVPDSSVLSDALLFEPIHSSREGAIGRLDDKCSETRLSLYSLYSSVSESADDGDEALSACDPTESLLPNWFDWFNTRKNTWSIIANYESLSLFMIHFSLYDCSESSTFDSPPLTSLSSISNLSAICDINNSSPIQPVLAEESDQIFLSLSNHKYSDLKTYNPDISLSSASLPSPPINDSPRISCSVATKRRSDDFLLYDSISADIGYQKKIKL